MSGLISFTLQRFWTRFLVWSYHPRAADSDGRRIPSYPCHITRTHCSLATATNPVRVPVLFSRYLSACLCSLAIALARPHPPTHALRSHILFMCATSVSLRCLDHRNEPEHTKPHSEPHSDKRQSAHARARERARVNRTRATRRSRSTHSFACIPAKNGLTIQFWSLSFEGPSRVPPLARARASCPY